MEYDETIYPEGSKEHEACEVIHSLLNFMLNRHIHKLIENGYVDEEKYNHEYGYEKGIPKKALKMKWELIREA